MSRRDKNKFVKQYKKKKNVYAWSKQELRFPTLCQHVHCLCVCLFVLWCLSWCAMFVCWHWWSSLCKFTFHQDK